MLLSFPCVGRVDPVAIPSLVRLRWRKRTSYPGFPRQHAAPEGWAVALFFASAGFSPSAAAHQGREAAPAEQARRQVTWFTRPITGGSTPPRRELLRWAAACARAAACGDGNDGSLLKLSARRGRSGAGRVTSSAMATAEKIEVKMPDGSGLELRPGTPRAPMRRPASGRSCEGGAGRKVDGALRRPDGAAQRRGEHSRSYRTGARRALADPPTRRTVLAESVLDIGRGKDRSIGPLQPNGFYYDIEFRWEPRRGRSARIEERMAEHVKADCEPFRAARGVNDEAIDLFRGQGRTTRSS